MTSRQFTETKAFFMLDPDAIAADLRAGTVAATVANASGGKRRDGKSWDASHFFRSLAPRSKREPAFRTWQQAKAAMMLAFGAP